MHIKKIMLCLGMIGSTLTNAQLLKPVHNQLRSSLVTIFAKLKAIDGVSIHHKALVNYYSGKKEVMSFKNVFATDQCGQTLLHRAADLGDVCAVRDLISRQADLYARDNQGRTPLHLAVSNVVTGDKKNTVRTLLAANCNPNVLDNRADTPIATISKESAFEIDSTESQALLKILLQSGSRVNTVNVKGEMPIHRYCNALSFPSVDALLHNGAQAHAVNPINGYTPLHYIVRSQYHYYDPQEVQYLLHMLVEYGAHIDAIDKQGRTPLHHAAYLGKSFWSKILISGGANKNIKDNDGKTPKDLEI